MNIPPHFIDEKKKQVVFHLKGGYSVSAEVPAWMESFPDEYKAITVRCEETFYKMREKQ